MVREVNKSKRGFADITIKKQNNGKKIIDIIELKVFRLPADIKEVCILEPENFDAYQKLNI